MQRAQLLEPAKKGPAGEGFEVQKFGSGKLPPFPRYCAMSNPMPEARISLLGFPSTGKSTLLSKCTKTESMTAAYEYTTLTGTTTHRLL